MREIVTHPDPVLTKVCRPVTDEELKEGKIDGQTIRELVEEMSELMRYDRQGIGLAAPQVGLPIRLFVVDLSMKETPIPLTFINPELSDPRGSVEMLEGCLSLPGVQVKVKRPAMIKVKAKNVDGKEFEIDANGSLARVCQHEFDHLQGVTILTKGNIIGNKKIKEALERMERAYKRWQERKQKKDI